MLVHSENFADALKKIETISPLANFVSIDCEFTGCGTNNNLYDRDAEIRY